MPLNLTKELHAANAEILKLVTFFFNQDFSLGLEAFSNLSIKSAAELASKDANPSNRTLWLYYGNFYTICERIRMSQHKAVEDRMGVEEKSPLVFKPEDLTVRAIGDLIHNTIQPFIAMKLKDQEKNSHDWTDFLRIPAFCDSFQALFDFTSVNEDCWQVMAILSPLMFDLAKMGPPVPRLETQIHWSLEDTSKL